MLKFQKFIKLELCGLVIKDILLVSNVSPKFGVIIPKTVEIMPHLMCTLSPF